MRFDTGSHDASARARSVPSRLHHLSPLLLALFPGLLIEASVASAQQVDSTFWVTNGPVYATALAGDRLYIGGSFNHLGPLTGGAVPVGVPSGTPLPGFPRIWGFVRTICADGSGGWFVGGVFDSVGGLERRNLAHIGADLSVDAWNPGADGPVWALAMHGLSGPSPRLFVAGDFTTIGGQSRRGIAALDLASGLATSWDASADGAVWVLVVVGGPFASGDLYAGGQFTAIGGQLRNQLASLDASTGLATGWNPDVGGEGSAIYALVKSDSSAGRLYVGGTFTSVGGQARNNIAELDGITGLATSWNPDASRPVETIAAVGDRVYVGGSFLLDPRIPPFPTIGGQPRNGVACLDATTGLATPWNPDANGRVLTLAVSGDLVFAGGEFQRIGGQDRSNVACLDTVAGVAAAWNPSADARVWAIAPMGSGAYLGGDFSSVGGRSRSFIAALDTRTGAATDWNPGSNRTVRAIAVNGNTVYAGGEFVSAAGEPSIGGAPRNGLAAIDASTGLATAWDPNVMGNVQALALGVDVIYAGGMFTTVGGQHRMYIAAVDVASGSPTAWDPSANQPVVALAAGGGAVFAGGGFTTIGGRSRSRIAALDPATGLAFDWDANALGAVYALLPTGVLYAGGSFGQIGGEVRRGVAALDFVTGHATGWNPSADRGPITSLAALGSVVYAGGYFGQIGGRARAFLAALDADSGLATDWNPGANNIVRSLAAGAGTIYAGGDFNRAGGMRRPYLAAISSSPAAGAPRIVMDQSSATGPIVRDPVLGIEIVTVPIRDSLDAAHPSIPPRDTVPSQARIDFFWHAVPLVPGSYPVLYRYRLDEPDFMTVDASVSGVSYNTGIGGDVVAPGTKLFTLRVVDNEGREREITRRFQLNHAPETWFAGPDLAALEARFHWAGRERALDIADWRSLPDLSGSLLSCDSLTRRPAVRPAHKTFFEIYGNRLYVRSENDTVHMNSWIVVHGGGNDLDSPYHVIVDPMDPALEDTARCAAAGTAWTVRPDGLTGSPIGIRSFHGTALEPGGTPFAISAPSLLFPAFDPTSPFRAPTIAAYAPMARSGKVYLVLRSEDADGARDPGVPTATAARAIADHVDGGIGTPEEIALRRKVLTFHVDKAPYLLFGQPGFSPQPNQSFPTRSLRLRLFAADDDPYDDLQGPPPSGGPTPNRVLRWNVTLVGTNAEGRAVSCSPLVEPSFTPQIDVQVPDSLTAPQVTVEVQLCDCATCESLPGSGRCVTYAIPVLVPPGATETLASLIAADASPGFVRLQWRVAASVAARLERRSAESDWLDLGDVRVDASGVATCEDRTVEPGARYGYRLAVRANGVWQNTGETWIDVPSAFEFALEGARPNPSSGGELTVYFSLASAGPGGLEILDLAGRRIAQHDLGSFGPGRHALRLGVEERVPPGLYLIRLRHSGLTRVTRVVVLE